MEWKLFDIDGSYIQDVNCQYDSLDIALYDNNAKSVKIDFSKKEAYIIEKDVENER